MKTNVNSFYDLLSIAKRDSAAMIYASSAATYGNLPSPQVVGKERPENPYGYSKYVMDQVARKYSNENPNLLIIGLRYFNIYGPKEYYKGNTASMVIQLAHQILDGNAPRLFKGSDQIFRDFIYIGDVIQAIIKACNSKKSGIYNVATGTPRNFQDIADILQKELCTSLGTKYFTNPFSGYQMFTQGEIKDTKTELGFQPRFSLEKGIKAYIPEILLLHSSDIS